MKRKIVLKESELVNIINKVINEKQSQDCKCCKAGVRTPPTDTILAWEAAKQHHRECCHRCEDEGGMVSNDGRRRKFNEQSKRPTPICNPPSKLTTTNISYQSATLRWTPVSNASSYEVTFNRQGISGWPVITNTPDTTLNVDNSNAGTYMMPSTTYHWSVRSICKDTKSDWAVGNGGYTDAGVSPETFTTII